MASHIVAELLRVVLRSTTLWMADLAGMASFVALLVDMVVQESDFAACLAGKVDCCAWLQQRDPSHHHRLVAEGYLPGGQ